MVEAVVAVVAVVACICTFPIHDSCFDLHDTDQVLGLVLAGRIDSPFDYNMAEHLVDEIDMEDVLCRSHCLGPFLDSYSC